jgi:hypothetical protein
MEDPVEARGAPLQGAVELRAISIYEIFLNDILHSVFYIPLTDDSHRWLFFATKPPVLANSVHRQHPEYF